MDENEDKSPAQIAEELAASGRCIICKIPKNNLQRGLCVSHRRDLGEQRIKLRNLGATDADVEAYEQEQIEAGRLLPNRRGERTDLPDRPENINPFGDPAEFLNKRRGIPKIPVRSVIEELKRVKRKPKK